MNFYMQNGWLIAGRKQVKPDGLCVEVYQNGQIDIEQNGRSFFGGPTTPSLLTDANGNAYADAGSIVAMLQTSQGAPFLLNGDQPGTAFGDDMVTVRREPTAAMKWSQGLASQGVTITDGTGGYWKVVAGASEGTFDGACECGLKAGAPNDARMIITTVEHLRYLPGRLSYGGGTVSFHTELANGDYRLMIGFILRGPKSLGMQEEVKDAIMFGKVGTSGVTTCRHQVYKNYELVSDSEIEIPSWLDFTKLQIFEQKFGYYGVHPAILKVLRNDNKLWSNETVHYEKFEQNTTSVADPNMAYGILVENAGNTANVYLRNGSVEIGNYTSRSETVEASGRPVNHSVSIASLSSDANDTDGSGVVGVYCVPDWIEMISLIEDAGATVVTSNFQNTIDNQLLALTVVGTVPANRPSRLQVRFVPITAVTLVAGQEFAAIGPNHNVLYFASAAQVSSIAFAQAIGTPLQFAISGTPTRFALSDRFIKLRPNFAAVVTTISSASTTITDLQTTVETVCLF